jgi:hypothetical protein
MATSYAKRAKSNMTFKKGGNVISVAGAARGIVGLIHQESLASYVENVIESQIIAYRLRDCCVG